MWKPLSHEISGYLPRVIKENLAQKRKVTFCNHENTLHAGLSCCQNTHSEVTFVWRNCDTPPRLPWDKGPIAPASEGQWTAFSRQPHQEMHLSYNEPSHPKPCPFPGSPFLEAESFWSMKTWLSGSTQDNLNGSSSTPHGAGQGSCWPSITSLLLLSSPLSSMGVGPKDTL